jgi:hypothetical protein
MSPSDLHGRQQRHSISRCAEQDACDNVRRQLLVGVGKLATSGPLSDLGENGPQLGVGSPPKLKHSSIGRGGFCSHGKGKKVKTRVTIKEVSPTTYTFTMDAQGPDGKWAQVVESKNTRR